jgi:hypothetical protein
MVPYKTVQLQNGAFQRKYLSMVRNKMIKHYKIVVVQNSTLLNSAVKKGTCKTVHTAPKGYITKRYITKQFIIVMVQFRNGLVGCVGGEGGGMDCLI